MKRIIPRSIRAKLALSLLLAALLPMSLTAYYNLQSSLQSVQRSEYEKLKLLAESTASRLNQVLEYNQYAIEQVAGNTAVIELLDQDVADQQMALQTLVETLKAAPDNAARFALAQPELTRLFGNNSRYIAVNETLQNILESNPDYEYVYLIDSRGMPIVERRLDTEPTIIGLDLQNRAYFREAFFNGQLYIDPLVGRSSKRLGFYFSSPIVNADQEPVGVAVIKVKGEAITDIVNDFTIGEEGYAFLVDQDGVVVSHEDPRWYYHSFEQITNQTIIDSINERFGPKLTQCDAQGRNCVIEYFNLPSLIQTIQATKNSLQSSQPIEYTDPLSATQQIVSFHRIEELNWVVGVNESEAEFSAPINRLSQQSLVIVVFVGVIVGILALLLARSIAGPIRKLASSAQAVEQGKPFEPHDLADVVAQGDEVGHLANVFSDMVLALRARMNELRTIYEIGTTISSSVDLDQTLDYIITTIKTVVPYDVAEICLYDKRTNTMIQHIAAGTKINVHGDVARSYGADESYVGLLMQKRSGILIADTSRFVDVGQNQATIWQQTRALSYLGIPLIFNNAVIGTIELMSKKVNGFTQDNLRMLESIAIQAAVVVHNAQEVRERESQLKAQITELRIEIDTAKRTKQVEEIVSTDFFQDLMQKASAARNRSRRSPNISDETPNETT